MIQVSNISKSFASQELFNNMSFKLNPGNRMGLVGRNGSGKSTLFKIILGEEGVDSGDVIIPKNYKIGALRQHLTFSEATLREEAALALSEEDQYNVYKVEKILFGLGFTQEDLEKDPLSFSGGYQIRINLAKLLVTEPNLLLLDEPTNYLDIVSMRWLKSFLQNFEGELILITHDRDFMDAVVTHTMGLIRRDIFIVPGDTHKFYEQLEANELLYEKQKESQEKKVKELEEFIARNKARASTAALAQSKVKQLEKMEIMEDLGFDSTLSFDFNFKETPAKVLLDVKDLSFGYTPEKILFRDISFTLEKGECLAIIGKNGQGKSTLLNTIAGELQPLEGSVTPHLSTTFAHFGQTNINCLNVKSTVMDEISAANPKLGASAIRSICGGMMFSGDSAKKSISLLSGGEKSRVMLGQILATNVNLLFLDEPTHHLDIDSIEALTQAIERFKGSSIIVSHSEELLRRVADRLIVFSSKGAEYFDGTYDEFLEKIGWEEESEGEGVKTKKKAKLNKKELKKARAELIQKRNKLRKPMQLLVEKLEGEIITHETELASLHSALESASSAADNAKIMELSQSVSKIEANIEEKFELMTQKHEEIDAITTEYDLLLEAL